MPPDRALNHHHSTFHEMPDRTIQERYHPFPCDDCAIESAAYGVLGKLLCTFCFQKDWLLKAADKESVIQEPK